MTRVLVFDSGLGGLSVVPELRLALPAASLTYAADAALFPYGDRPASLLRAHLVDTLGFLIEQEQPSVVVLACNTASTLALDALRVAFPGMAFVGTVPALKPAARTSRTRVIGLLATPGTVSSLYIDTLKDQVAPDCILVRHGSSRLAKIAETWLCRDTIEANEIAAETAPLFKNPLLDTVVLGCTHYPLLRCYLESTAPRPVTWLDSGAAIARQAARLVNNNRPDGPDRVLVSAIPDGYDKAMARLGLPAPCLWHTGNRSALQNLESNPA